ncbi:MAG TPA: ATP-binding protein [bacterium]|nr:ATP-binding protein [bacterium]HPV65201.1 ATP-binding protein [bacterium]
MISFTFILPIVSILSLILGFYVFFNNYKSFINIVFLFFCLSVSGWIFSVFFLINFSQDVVWGELPFFFAGCMVCFLLIFILKIDNAKTNNYLYFLVLAPIIIISYLLFTEKIIESVVLVSDNFVVTSFSEYYNLFVVYALAYVLCIFLCLIYKYIKSAGLERARIKYVLFGILSFIVPVTFTNMILPTFFDIWIFNGIGPIFSLFMVVFIAYAIVRYRLMDIYFVFRLGTIFSLLLFSIIFIYISLSYLFLKLFNISYPFDLIISSFVITLSFLPLKRFIEFITDKIFFRRYYKFDDVLSKIRGELRLSGLDLDKNLAGVNKIVSSVLKVDRSIIAILIPKDHFISKQIIGVNQEEIRIRYHSPIISYLMDCPDGVLDKESIKKCESSSDKPIDLNTQKSILKEMDRLKVSLIVPISLKNKLIGVYLLGDKKSGSAFNSRDLKLLKHITWELGYVIDNARSYEELKRLDDSKSKFISVVSHQLRTPATISKYNLELALDKNIGLDDRSKAILDAYEGVLLFSRQLDQLLLVLEIEDKDMKIDKKSVDLELFFDDFLKRNKLLLKTKKLKLETKLDFPKNKVRFDANKINKVLDIIFLNSVNYSNLKGKIIISSWIKKFNKKNNLIFAFSDFGIGIKEDDKPNIFKKFYRGSDAGIMSPSGFGLGLFIAKKIIKSHGGDLWFEDNNDSRGAIFYFSLPL